MDLFPTTPILSKQPLLTRLNPSTPLHSISRPQVWCQLITLAGRAGQPDLAHIYFRACLASGCELSTHVFNALMATLAKDSQVEQVRRELGVDGLGAGGQEATERRGAWVVVGWI